MEVLAARWHKFERLTTKLGQPVWPICAEEDLQCLARFVDGQGAQLNFVEAFASSDAEAIANCDSGECVVATSAQVYPLCLVYAHLTLRRSVFVSQHELASFNSTVAALITMRGDFQNATEAAMLRIGLRQHSWPGLIIGETEDELRRTVILNAAALFLDSVGTSPDLAVYPHLDVGISDTSSRHVVDATNIDARTDEVLSNKYNIISIYTHGDGTDIRWGEKPMCSIPRLIGTIGPSLNQPSCVTYNRCYRLNESLRSEPTHPQTVDPRLLSAKVLVLASCWGIQISPTVIDSRWSIARSLSASENLVAFLVTVNAMILNPQQVEQLYLLLSTRESVGLALREFNALQFTVKSGVYFHLCGDPGICARTSNSPIATIDWPSEEARKATANDLISLLKEVIGSQNFELDLTRTKACDGELKQQESIEVQTRGHNLELLKKLANYGSHMNRIWRPYATFGGAEDGGECAFCGSFVTSLKFEIFESSRVVNNCHRCGVVGDLAPDHQRFTVDWDQLAIAVERSNFEKAAVAVLLVETDWKSDAEIIEFTTAGSKLELVRPITCDRLGFYYLTVFFHSGEDLSVLRRSGFRKIDGRLDYFHDGLVSASQDD